MDEKMCPFSSIPFTKCGKKGILPSQFKKMMNEIKRGRAIYPASFRESLLLLFGFGIEHLPTTIGAAAWARVV
jgi:hypothetical protein